MSISRRNFFKMGAASAAGISLANYGWMSALAKPVNRVNPTVARQRDDITVAFIVQQMAAQSGQRALAGYENWVENSGVNWETVVTDAQGDPGQLSSMVEDAVSREVDAIVVAFGTLTAAQGALETVAEAGTPLFSIDSGYFPPAVCDIASNNYVMGSQMGSYLVQSLLARGKTEPNILRITANFHHGTRKRGKALDIILSENENINVLGDQVIQYEGFFENTLNTVNDWINRYGEDIDAVWCPWDEPAQAASQALISQGFDFNDAFVIGADGHPPAVEEMRDEAYPLLATPAQAFELWGALSGSYIDEIIGKGRPTREVVPVPQIDFPAPFLVKGVNLPEAGLQPWQTVDFYQLFLEQAQGSI